VKGLLTILAAAVVLIVLIAPAGVLAGGAEVTVRVDGLGCPFCAYGIEKKIKKLEGVEAVRVDLEAGKVVVTYEDKKFFTSEGLEEAVKDAGFTPGKIELEEAGR